VSATQRIRLCAADALPVGGMRRFDVAGRAVALYHLEDGFYATDAICSHAQAVLTDGQLRGGRVVCPLHGARFDVRSGRVLSPPAFRPLRTYPVQVEDGAVFVEIPAPVGSLRG